MCVSEGAAGTSLIVVIVIVLVMAPRFSLPVSIAPVRIFPLVIARVAVNNRWPINYGRRSIPYRRWSVVDDRSEEHTSELQSIMRIPYAVFGLKKKNVKTTHHTHTVS